MLASQRLSRRCQGRKLDELLPMIEAKTAGEAMMSIGTVLHEHQVIDDPGLNAIQRVGSNLKGKKTASSWDFEVSTGEPITFTEVNDRSGTAIRPRIVAMISVNQDHETKPPFSSLDIALEISDSLSQPISRWHIDLANEQADGWQDGPLIHLQYGGHRHNHPLRAPRWCHPPMEVALLCELVAANFYPQKWAQFREAPNWAKAIKLYEGLCYSNYLACLNKLVDVSGAPSALTGMWAGNWV
jgi:hypothetical protein